MILNETNTQIWKIIETWNEVRKKEKEIKTGLSVFIRLIETAVSKKEADFGFWKFDARLVI